MIEVEIKILIQNKENIIAKLEELGFVMSSSVEELDRYFDNEVHQIRGADQALRVRTVRNLLSEKEASCITFKGKKLDAISVTREELETTVEDPQTAVKILEALGFSVMPPVVRKYRREYTWNHITACIDVVDGLGDFLELETMVPEDQDRDTALEVLQTLMDKLGVSMKDTTRNSYLSMLQGYQES